MRISLTGLEKDYRGRWSRLLANIWLKLHGRALTMWPEEAVGTPSLIRKEYIEAIKQADVGAYDLLRGLHLRYTSES